MNINNKPIITEEYFEILSKQNLKPEDIVKKNSYENFIKLCKKYEPYISPAAQSILSEYNSRTMALDSKENKTAYEENVLKDFQSVFNEEENLENNNGPVRKLLKAGYIDASIILAVLLNIGFIIALSILKK